MSHPANGLNGTLAKLPSPPGNNTRSILRMHWVCPEDVHGSVRSQGGGGGVSAGGQTLALSVPVSEIGDACGQCI
jgi:hypothetical protein